MMRILSCVVVVAVLVPRGATAQPSGFSLTLGSWRAMENLVESGADHAWLPTSWRVGVAREWRLASERLVWVGVNLVIPGRLEVRYPAEESQTASGSTAAPGVAHLTLAAAPIGWIWRLQPYGIAGVASYLFAPPGRGCILSYPESRICDLGKKYSGTHTGASYGYGVRYRFGRCTCAAIDVAHVISDSPERLQRDWAIGLVILPGRESREAP